ncbi:hypothetical protein GEMRC1_011867 [Eukaryota sp. GEM-RC1]
MGGEDSELLEEISKYSALQSETELLCNLLSLLSVDSISDLPTEIESILTQLNNANTALGKLETDKSVAERTAAAAEASLTSLNDELSLKSTEYLKLTDKYEDLLTDFSTEQRSRQKFSELFNLCQLDLFYSSKRLNNLKQNFDVLIKKVQNLGKSLNISCSEFQTNNSDEFEYLQFSMNQFHDQIKTNFSTLNQQILTKDQTISSLSSQLDTTLNENTGLKALVSDLNNRVTELTSTLTELESSSKDRQTKLQDQISSLIEDNDVLNLQLTKSETELSVANTLISELQENCSKLSTTNHHLSEELTEKGSQLLNLDQQFNSLNSTLAEVQSENLNLKSIGAQQSEELNSLQSDLDGVLSSIKFDLSDLSSDLLRNELSDFQVNELSDVSLVVSNLKNLLVMLSNSNADLDEKYSNISTTCVELEATLEQLKTENSRISSDLSLTNNEVDRLKSVQNQTLMEKEEVQTKLQDQISSLIDDNDVLNVNLTKEKLNYLKPRLSFLNYKKIVPNCQLLIINYQQFNNLNSTLLELQSENLNLKSIGAQQSEVLNSLQSNLDGVLSSIKNDLSDLSSVLLRNELSAFQVNEFSDVTVVVSNLKNQLEMLSNSNVDLDENYLNVSTTCVELKATLEQLKTENFRISSDLSFTNDEINRLKSIQKQTLMEKEEVQTKLQDQISSLIEDNDVLNLNLTNRETELSEAKTLISELQENCSKLSTTNHHLSEELTEKGSQLLNLDQQFNNLNSTLAEVQSENLNLKSIGVQQSEELNSLQSDLDGVLSSIKNDLSALSSDLLRNELSDFQVNELSGVTVVVSNLKNLLVMLSNSNVDLDEKYSNISTTCVKLEATLEQLKTENFRISSDLSLTNDEINRLKSIQKQTLMEKEEVQTKLQDQISSLIEDNDVLNLNLTNRETELSEAKTLISELQENCSKLSTTNHHLSEELTEKGSQLLNLDQQFNSLNSTLAEVQSENLNLKSIGAQQSEELNSLQSDLDGVLSSIKFDLSDLSSDLLRNELSDFQVNELSGVTVVVSNLKNLLVMLSNSNADLDEKFSNISTTCVELEATLEQLKTENSRISNALSFTNDEINRLKSIQNQTLMEKEEVQTNLKDQISSLIQKTELSEAKTLISELQENCSKLSTTYHQLSEELTEKNSQLLNLDQQFNNLNSTLSEVQSENLNLKSIGAQQSEKLNSLQSNLDGVLSSIKNDLSDLFSDLLRNELSEFQVNELSDVSLVVSNLKNLLVMLSNSNADLNKKYSNISTSCVELEATLEQLKTENFRISSDLSLTNDEIDRLKSIQNQTLMEKEEVQTKLKDQISSSHSEIDALKLEISGKNSELSNNQSLIDELNCNIHHLSLSKTSLNQELNLKNDQISQLTDSLNNSQLLESKLLNQISTLEAQRLSVTNKLDNLVQDYQRLESKSVESTSKISELDLLLHQFTTQSNEQILNFQNRESALTHDLNILKEQLHDKETDLGNQIATNLDFKSTISQLESKIQLLTEECSHKVEQNCGLNDNIETLNKLISVLEQNNLELKDQKSKLESKNSEMSDSFNSLTTEINTSLSSIKSDLINIGCESILHVPSDSSFSSTAKFTLVVSELCKQIIENNSCIDLLENQTNELIVSESHSKAQVVELQQEISSLSTNLTNLLENHQKLKSKLCQISMEKKKFRLNYNSKLHH